MPELEQKCPVCAKPSAPKYNPFCSKHCADVDLGRWFKGDYKVETEELVEDEEGK